jgi:hypothetical protein
VKSDGGGGVSTGQVSCRYSEDLGEDLPSREVMAEGAMVGSRRIQIGRADAWSTVGTDWVEHGGDVVAASGQGVESAAEDHDRSVQDDQATDQEGVTQTRDHVIRMIQGLKACEDADKTCQTRRKGISRMSFIIRPGIDGVNAAFPTRCCPLAQHARNARSLLSRGLGPSKFL